MSSIDVRNNVNSAIISGISGLQKASDGISQASINIAQKTAQSRDTADVLSDSALQQIGSVKQLLPKGGDDITSDLVALSVNSINAQASSKVLDVVKNTIGRIIDETA